MKVLIPFFGWLFVASVGVDIVEFMWGKAPEFTTYMILLAGGAVVSWFLFKLYQRFLKAEDSIKKIDESLQKTQENIQHLATRTEESIQHLATRTEQSIQRLEEKIRIVADKTDQNTKDVRILEVKVDAVIEKVNKLEVRFEKLEEKFDKVAENQSALNASFETLIGILSGKSPSLRWIEP